MSSKTLNERSVSSVNSISIGTIIPYCGFAAPSGWLICNGDSFDSAQYPVLANLVGNTYSASSGTTYYLPDLRGKAPMGIGTGVRNNGSGSLTARALGSTGGTETETVTSSTGGNRSHSHTTTFSGSISHSGGHTIRGIGASTSSRSGSAGLIITNPTSSTALINSAGLTFTPGAATYNAATIAHNNMQSSIVINFIIKAA